MGSGTSRGTTSDTSTSQMKTVSKRPAIQGSSLPTSVCGNDERVQVQPMTSPPYNWICFLIIESANGKFYGGTGFKIHLPDASYTAIVTCGHNTYVDGAMATKITVLFPGGTAIDVGPSDLYAAPEFIADPNNANYDYGLILLTGTSDDGFGWSAIVEDDELNNRLVSVCGYPGDKTQGTMWITGGPITSYTDYQLFYMNDTYGGESGSPVYTWYGGYWTVLGIHRGGTCPNYATRFTTQMISRFLQRMNDLQTKTLRSTEFPNVYLRCDGKGVTQFNASGGGTVNCQYIPAGSYEQFHIYPVEATPSLALVSSIKMVIASVWFNNVFIRMDGTGMNQHENSGGGKVNCQFTAGAHEVFFQKAESSSFPGSCSFQSVQFPNCYLRLDGSGVNSWNDNGGGTVNCQWYATGTTPGPWEIFLPEPI